MSSIITMATKITHENYPIVQACLPPGFLMVPPSNVIGNYLVINEVNPGNTKKNGIMRSVRIGNSHYTKDLFKETYEAAGKKDSTGFFEVRIRAVR